MNIDVTGIVELIAALGLGGVLSTVIGYFKDRKKTVSETHKTDAETTLIYLNATIEQLSKENQRLVVNCERLEEDLLEKEARNQLQRQRIRDLEDEIDSVRRSARETQLKCDELATRLEELIDDAQEETS